MATNNALKTASVLAFERKLDPSDALLFSGSWNARQNDAAWAPITVREKSVRGTISNRLKTKDQDPAKLDAAIENPNPQTVDVATLPASADTLKVTFSLRVLGGFGIPCACNEEAYQAKLLAIAQDYLQRVGVQELASRYAYNLANGRFLWRNRLGAEQVEIQIRQFTDGVAAKAWTFDGLELPTDRFDPGAASAQLKELSGLIADGLAGKSHVLLHIGGFARLGAGQEVYPSQELIMERARGDKSKTLYKVGEIAGMHSQKLGNAIRTIDTWHPKAAEIGPIPVEPHGSVTSRGVAYRKAASVNFYNLLDDWLLKDRVPALDQQHFVMATLIRGGVFGASGKE